MQDVQLHTHFLVPSIGIKTKFFSKEFGFIYTLHTQIQVASFIPVKYRNSTLLSNHHETWSKGPPFFMMIAQKIVDFFISGQFLNYSVSHLF